MGETSENTVVDYTIDAMRDAIRTGVFAPGQRLIVADITKMFSVSAGPVREAIRRLTGEGLIEIQPHRGASVRKYSSAELHEIHQARAAIEGMAAGLAATNADAQEHREALREIREDMDRAAASEDLSGFLVNNQRFHDLILKMANNRVLRELAQQLVLPLYQFRLPHRLTVSELHSSYSFHQRIIAAILSGKSSLAEATMREHILHAGEQVIAVAEEANATLASDPRRKNNSVEA